MIESLNLAEHTPETLLYALYNYYRQPSLMPVVSHLDDRPASAAFASYDLDSDAVCDQIGAAYHWLNTHLARQVDAEAHFVWYKTAHLIYQQRVATFAGLMAGVTDGAPVELQPIIIKWRDCLQVAINDLPDRFHQHIFWSSCIAGQMAKLESAHAGVERKKRFINLCLMVLGIEPTVQAGLGLVEREWDWYNKLSDSHKWDINQYADHAKRFYKPMLDRYRPIAAKRESLPPMLAEWIRDAEQR